MPIEYYSPVSGGAIATIIAQVSRELLAMGHQVTVLTPMDGQSFYEIGEVFPLEVKRRQDLGFLRRRLSGLRKRVGRWDWPYFEHYLKSVKERLAAGSSPDVVVLFNDLYSSPHIRKVVPHAKIAVWLQNEWRTHSANLRKTVSATDIFLTCSSYIRDWTANAHGIPRSKFSVVPSGVNLEEFYPRKGFTDRSEPVKVLFIGRIDRNKGPDIAVDAVVALRNDFPCLTLTVAGGLWFYNKGDPMSDPFFQELRGKMHVSQATYLGHLVRADIPRVVRDHDIVLILSRSNEPFGLVTLEAMASGCAVIASNRGGLPEACDGAAMLVDPDDFAAVVNALRSLVASPSEMMKLKGRSVARALRGGWDATASRFIESISSATVAA